MSGAESVSACESVWLWDGDSDSVTVSDIGVVKLAVLSSVREFETLSDNVMSSVKEAEGVGVRRLSDAVTSSDLDWVTVCDTVPVADSESVTSLVADMVVEELTDDVLWSLSEALSVVEMLSDVVGVIVKLCEEV